MSIWFRRLAEIPGVDYAGNPGVNRQSLPEHNAVPEVHTISFEGKSHESLWWKTREGGTTASPAIRLTITPRTGETPTQTALRQMRERVELPGEISDYHFAIQQAIEELWRYRAQEPWVLQEIEKLCWLDIRLCTRSVSTFQREDGSLFYITAFHKLITLFEREGYIREALELAQFAIKLGANTEIAEALQARVIVLDQEEGV